MIKITNEKTKIQTKFAHYVDLQLIRDAVRGDLHIVEGSRHIPFEIRRVYMISNVSNDIERGGHAHRTHDQVIVPIRGSFVLLIDDGEQTQELELSDPAVGVRMMPKLWHKMFGFSQDAVVVVYANAHYDEADYLRDYDEYLDHIKQYAD